MFNIQLTSSTKLQLPRNTAPDHLTTFLTFLHDVNMFIDFSDINLSHHPVDASSAETGAIQDN